MKDLFSKYLLDTQILTASSELQYFGKDVCQQFSASPCCILLPSSVEELANCVKVAYENKIPIVPSAGRTGYSAGASATNGEAIISVTKLNKILDFNSVNRTITVQAGVPLEVVQNYAKDNGMYYPVDFTSRGSCLIGGTIATNAGGVRVIRHGLTRDQVLGLKVVTGNGEILDLSTPLIKNQTGYDLKQLFVGSEGTLGIIAEATLKLASLPSDCSLACCAFLDPKDILPTLVKLRKAGLVIDLFEFMEESGLELVLKHNSLTRPFQGKYPCCALIEIDRSRNNASEIFENTLSELIESGEIADVVISESSKQYQDLMALRELIGETANQHYTVHKNDISVLPSDIPAFLSQLKTLLITNQVEYPNVIFGHIGDGNLHVNILMPKDLDRGKFWEFCEQLDHKIFALVKTFHGSISAEHGVGLLKKNFLHFSRTENEINLMRAIKKVFDPAGIMNPGKIF